MLTRVRPQRVKHSLQFYLYLGHVKIIEWLLQQGQTVIRDDLGGTPLHDAAEHGQFEVRILVETYSETKFKK